MLCSRKDWRTSSPALPSGKSAARRSRNHLSPIPALRRSSVDPQGDGEVRVENHKNVSRGRVLRLVHAEETRKESQLFGAAGRIILDLQVFSKRTQERDLE
jgi:hypothetical protein